MQQPVHPAQAYEGFVRRCGTRIVGPEGEEALRRGMGLGTWLLPEGYMWRFPHVEPGNGVLAASPREIEALFSRLVGEQRAQLFWLAWRDAFLTQADIERMKAEGFDHVRLPINSRLLITDDGELLEEGFALVERCVEWCRKVGLYVVLDLHGAPGGQTGTNIDDSPHGRPDLFARTEEGAKFRDLTVLLWVELANRYADDTTVAAYDLLNEPLPNEYAESHASDLVALYRRLTEAIREVDGNHLIMYEGPHWASDVSIFTEVWDENSAIQFHRYWAPPDRPGIQKYLDVREELGLPIWMGEGGENGTEWVTTIFDLYEREGIGWNFWTWKKIDNPHSPAVVVPPSGWHAIIDFVAGEGPQPDADAAWQTLQDLVDAVKLENCTWHPEVVNALMRKPPLTLPCYSFSSIRSDGEGLEWLHSDQPMRLTYVGGEPDANPFAPDPAERARAGRFELELVAGDEVTWRVAAEPGTCQVIIRGEASKDARVVVQLARVGVEARATQQGLVAMSEVCKDADGLVIRAESGTVNVRTIDIT